MASDLVSTKDQWQHKHREKTGSVFITVKLSGWSTFVTVGIGLGQTNVVRCCELDDGRRLVKLDDNIQAPQLYGLKREKEISVARHELQLGVAKLLFVATLLFAALHHSIPPSQP